MENIEFEDEDDLVFEGDITVKEICWYENMGLEETLDIMLPIKVIKVQM